MSPDPSCIGILQAALIRAKGRADWWMWYQLLQQITTAIVVLAFASHGILPVVAAIAVKTWLIWPAVAALTCRLLDLSVLAYLRQFLLPLAASFVMAAAVLGVRHVMPAGSVPALMMQVAVGAMVYVTTVLLLGHQRLVQLRMTILRR